MFVYRRNGEVGRLAVPTEFNDRGDDCKVKVDMGHTEVLEMSCTNWARELKPTLDSQGNLVLLGRDQEVPGAIADPETGCYAVVRKPDPSRVYDALHIYQDSALVFHYSVYETELPPGLEIPAGGQPRLLLFPLLQTGYPSPAAPGQRRPVPGDVDVGG